MYIQRMNYLIYPLQVSLKVSLKLSRAFYCLGSIFNLSRTNHSILDSVLYGEILNDLHNNLSNWLWQNAKIEWKCILACRAILNIVPPLVSIFFVNPNQAMSTMSSVNPPPWVEIVIKSISAIKAKITDLNEKILVVDEQVKKLENVGEKRNTFDRKK